VEILCGEQGARILDAHRYHGLRARIVRAFQQIGYDEITLAIYDEVLGHGELVLHVRRPRPTVTASRRCCIATRFTMWLLRARHVRAVPALNWADLGQGLCPATTRPRPWQGDLAAQVPVIPAVNRLDR
jgi:hypothetical protein